MSQINIKKTDTPETPNTDRVGIFINVAGEAKVIDDTGTQTLLAGIAEAPIDGLTYNRKDGAWVLVKAIPATFRENNTVLFDGDYISGINAAARTGNILFDFTGVSLGATTEMRHNDAGAFTFPAEAVLMFASADISTTVDNYFMFELVDNTVAAEIVHVFHAIEGGV
jgi:hypothetical protein